MTLILAGTVVTAKTAQPFHGTIWPERRGTISMKPLRHSHFHAVPGGTLNPLRQYLKLSLRGRSVPPRLLGGRSGTISRNLAQSARKRVDGPETEHTAQPRAPSVDITAGTCWFHGKLSCISNANHPSSGVEYQPGKIMGISAASVGRVLGAATEPTAARMCAISDAGQRTLGAIQGLAMRKPYPIEIITKKTGVRWGWPEPKDRALYPTFSASFAAIFLWNSGFALRNLGSSEIRAVFHRKSWSTEIWSRLGLEM
jgi:hypothetical protein